MMFCKSIVLSLSILVILIVSGPAGVQADEPLSYAVDLRIHSEPNPGEPVQAGRLQIGGFGGSPPARKSQSIPDMAAEVTLTNIGTTSQVVRWPEWGDLNVYQFEFLHVETGQRIPVLSPPSYAPWQPPSAVSKDQFETLEPGQALVKQIKILGQDHGGQATLRRAGKYQLIARLSQNVVRSYDEQTGRVAEVPNVWTGTLDANPTEFTLAKGRVASEHAVSLPGRVVSHAGNPVAGAIVQLKINSAPELKFDKRNAKDWGRVRTDSHGEFLFLDVPDECDYGFTITTKEYSRDFIVYSHDKFLAKKPIVLKMAQMFAVRGQVADRAGNPLAMVLVNSRTFTDSEGRFEMHLPTPENGQTLRIKLGRNGYVRNDQKVLWRDAIAGKLQLSMFSEEEMSITGRAWANNETPLGEARLVFAFSDNADPDSLLHSQRDFRTMTDKQGNFTVIMPTHRAVQAQVVAEQEPSFGSTRRRRTEVDHLQAGQMPLKLNFDQPGRIIVRIFHGTKPSANKAVSVSVRHIERAGTVISERLTPSDSGRVFSGLEPGKYCIRASVQGPPRRSVETTVTIPATAPYRTLAVLRTPKLESGSSGTASPTLNMNLLLGESHKKPTASGRVTAALTYADGSSVRGYTLLNVHEAGSPWLRPLSKIGMAQGYYKKGDITGLPAPAGEVIAVIEHFGTSRPSNFMPGGAWIPANYLRLLYARVGSEANRTVHPNHSPQSRRT